MVETVELVSVKGHMKWFDTTKGYGFMVTAEDGDVLVHSKILRQCGYAPDLQQGTLIECEAERMPGRGLRAVKVTSVDTTSLQVQRTERLVAQLDGRVTAEQLRMALVASGLKLAAE